MQRGTGILCWVLPILSSLDSLLQILLPINSPHLPHCSQMPPLLQRLTPTSLPVLSAQLLPECLPGDAASPPPAGLTALFRAPPPGSLLASKAQCRLPPARAVQRPTASIPSASMRQPPGSLHSPSPAAPAPQPFFLISLSSFPSYLFFSPISFRPDIGIQSESKSVHPSSDCCNSMDCSPPGSSVYGIIQARILEWVSVPFSRASSRLRDRTRVS